MATLHIGGAGGAPGNNVIRSLRESSRNDYLVGTTCNAADLLLANVDERHFVPPAMSAEYPERLFSLLRKNKPQLIQLTHDFEVRAVSRLRDQVAALGVEHFLPAAETVENCVDKGRSTALWQAAGIRVPKTLIVNTPQDLQRAFDEFGETIWIRATEGGGGKGALPTSDYEFARIWIERFNGWGEFTAAELLSSQSVTWLSIWHEGELVVAQSRRRHAWNFGDRTLSGVTGVTGVGETCADPTVDRVALDSIAAIDSRPHGIFAVDMTYDQSGFPNPTEINIGRFFTTVYFFAKAGLNMPEMYANIAVDGNFPSLDKKINPLPEGLVWIRGMDVDPVLTTADELRALQDHEESGDEPIRKIA